MSEWTLPAVPTAVAQMRRHAVDFAATMGVSHEIVEAVRLAVSEAVTNVVVHAYVGRESGPVTLRCRMDGEHLAVEVADEGRGVVARDDSPGLGHGLATVGALVRTLEVAPRHGAHGTVIRMSFGEQVEPPAVSGLEPLCALALERVADVSCIDIVSGGVLRRNAAEVAGDPALTEWLRTAVPPAKPGTATWTALREGGPRLIVHDPSVPRSIGGTGEHLGLVWWISVPLDGPDGEPIALWGLGGRNGGRPVPSDAVIRALAVSAQDDLSAEPGRARLRARLALA